MKFLTHTYEIQTFLKQLVIYREKKRVLNSIAWETLIPITSNNEHWLGGIAAYNMASAGGIIEEQVSCDHSIMDTYVQLYTDLYISFTWVPEVSYNSN